VTISLLDRAIEYATEKHKTQRRKYMSMNYITHPLTVMEIVRANVPCHTPDMLCAAVLHDVVEDTNATIDDIDKIFGSDIANHVYYLTDISKPTDGNRRIRKEIDLNHISAGGFEVHTIKLADLIDNSMSILLFDRNFAKVYINEKERLIKVLVNGYAPLHKIAQEIITEYRKQKIV